MQKLHLLSDSDDESLDKLKSILIDLTDNTYKKIREIQKLKIKVESLNNETLSGTDVLITVFSNLISNIIGKILMDANINIKLSIAYYEDITNKIFQGCQEFFKYFIEINTIDKKDIH